MKEKGFFQTNLLNHCLFIFFKEISNVNELNIDPYFSGDCDNYEFCFN